ncbi:MAG: chalcone isomerase family protein [Rhizobacter sp.]|nr:chalcone isomerase family protein [Burkholderiales bacterium]
MRIDSYAAAFAASVALAATPIAAATLEGQRFEDNARLATQDLALNGLGLRSILFIKVYVAGLYLPEKKATLDAILNLQGPKRLQLRMLRKADPDDFIEALVEGIEDNSSKAELAQLNVRVRQLEQNIIAIGSVVAGDSINFDFVPGIGTSISINSVRKGTVIGGADFYNAVLKIFIGQHPVDDRLKAGLLGR